MAAQVQAATGGATYGGAGYGVTARGTGWTRAAALTGVVFAVLLIASFLLTANSPSTSSSAAKVGHYYVTHQHRIGASALLTMLAVAVGLGFYLYLRTYYRRVIGVDWLASLFFVGAVVFALSGVLGAGLQFAAADHPKSLTPQTLQLLNTLEENVGWAALCTGLILLYVALGIVILRLGMPRWLAWLSWLMALLAASFFLSFIPFLVAPLWAIVVSIRMAMRNPAVT